MQLIIHTQSVTIAPPPAMMELVASECIAPAPRAAGAPPIGAHWPEQGGVIAGIMPAQDGHKAYYLIAPTNAATEAEGLIWGGYGTEIDDLSTWDGKANTTLLAQSGDYLAAKFCNSLKIDSFNDFYLPSRREASLLAATVPHLFKAGWHWTSTQYSANNAFVQGFDDGYQGNTSKVSKYRVRAVRRFLID